MLWVIRLLLSTRGRGRGGGEEENNVCKKTKRYSFLRRGVPRKKGRCNYKSRFTATLLVVPRGRLQELEYWTVSRTVPALGWKRVSGRGARDAIWHVGTGDERGGERSAKRTVPVSGGPLRTNPGRKGERLRCRALARSWSSEICRWRDKMRQRGLNSL